GGDGPHLVVHREVPGGDHSDYTERLVDDVDPTSRCPRGDPTPVETLRFACRPAKLIGSTIPLGPGLSKRLTRLLGCDPGELVQIGLDVSGGPLEDLAPVIGRQTRPGRE